MESIEFVYFKFLLFMIITNLITGTRSTTISRFQRHSDGRFTSELGTTNTYTVETCIYLCKKTPTCESISYEWRTQQCDLGSESPTLEHINVDPNWVMYFKTELNGKLPSKFVLVDVQMTWADANNYCQTTYSGHLAIIKTESTMNQLITLLDEHPHVVSVWAGATDSAVEGDWVWTDNSLVYDGYTRWQPHQPDNNNGDEDCLVFYYQPQLYQWNDANCLVLSRSICEYY